MNIQQWLSRSISQLKESGIESAAIDARVIMAAALGVDSEKLVLMDPAVSLDPVAIKVANTMLESRLTNKPLSQIIGWREFYGYQFYVDENVLTPRPDSEAIVERAIELLASGVTSVSDIGTGSGCLIVSIAAETRQPDSTLIGCDNSPEALRVAKRNAEKHTGTGAVELVEADIYQPSANLDRCLNTNVIIANLPYVPDDYAINSGATFDPPEALFSGPSGLQHYEQLFDLVAKHQDQTILIEHLDEQFPQLSNLAKSKLTNLVSIERISPLVSQINL